MAHAAPEGATLCRNMDQWIVHKFGGSSVADAGCFRRVADIIEASSNPREAVVLSACRGVTDALLNSVALAERPDGDMAGAIEELWKRHEQLAAELLSPAACETLLRAAREGLPRHRGRAANRAPDPPGDVFDARRDRRLWRDLVHPAVRAVSARARAHRGRGGVDRCARHHHRRVGPLGAGRSVGAERAEPAASACPRASRAGSS